MLYTTSYLIEFSKGLASQIKICRGKSTSMPTQYHFDIPVDNTCRAKQFYKHVFGLDMKKLYSQVDSKIELWMCATDDDSGRKGITGGMMKSDLLSLVTNYILINSLDE